MIQLHEIKGNPMVVFGEDGTPIPSCELVAIGSEAHYSMEIFPEITKTRKVHTFRCACDAKTLRAIAKALLGYAKTMEGKA